MSDSNNGAGAVGPTSDAQNDDVLRFAELCKNFDSFRDADPVELQQLMQLMREMIVNGPVKAKARAAPMTDDTLITLRDACEIFFGGRVTVATLKAEHAKGNLDMSKIGRSYWTTIAKLKDMDQKCRVEAPVPSSGGTKTVKAGPSSTDAAAAARVSALKKLSERKQLLGITSRRSTR